MKGLAKEHICITPKHRQQYGDEQRAEGEGDGQRWAKGGGMGTSVIVSTIKK